ncbi:nucleotidyltransferase family protein [Brevundimonas naejangsanensis]|uniref:Nucleotidyltransferase family protein n=1 Tax=Brevundimonas naejangsanensis TaxID=588932 RepID=A0A494RGF5_9CAUL|nr:nucleotidyltransferase family protein [Brevundimonas naejangsanensis]AYG94193.1 nucleotidyltransferase family protein [Brevundimonas naejangsanensis]
MTLETRLIDIVRADADLMHVLTVMRDLDLPDWRLFSGAVYQGVWNERTGRPTGYGVKDYDIGYFDSDVSWDAEDVIIKRGAAAFDPPFRDLVEVRNQARVHLWFEQKFGEPYEALTCTDDAPAQFVAPAFAVAVRLEGDDTISVAAPYGLQDVFDMVIRPNPTRGLAKGWDRVIAGVRARWPEITVIGPE